MWSQKPEFDSLSWPLPSSVQERHLPSCSEYHSLHLQNWDQHQLHNLQGPGQHGSAVPCTARIKDNVKAVTRVLQPSTGPFELRAV